MSQNLSYAAVVIGALRVKNAFQYKDNSLRSQCQKACL